MKKFLCVLLTAMLLMISVPVYGATEKVDNEEYTVVINGNETDTVIDRNIATIEKVLKVAGITVLKDEELKQLQINAKKISQTYVKTLYMALNMVPGGKLIIEAIDTTFDSILK